jgi:hypothetical protein
VVEGVVCGECGWLVEGVVGMVWMAGVEG